MFSKWTQTLKRSSPEFSARGTPALATWSPPAGDLALHARIPGQGGAELGRSGHEPLVLCSSPPMPGAGRGQRQRGGGAGSSSPPPLPHPSASAVSDRTHFVHSFGLRHFSQISSSAANIYDLGNPQHFTVGSLFSWETISGNGTQEGKFRGKERSPYWERECGGGEEMSEIESKALGPGGWGVGPGRGSRVGVGRPP